MGHKEHPVSGRNSNRNLARLLGGVIWIVEGEGHGVEVDRRRLRERNAVFPEIGGGLFRIPFIRHLRTMEWSGD